VASVFHTLSLLASSFVEEEHQTWYFLTVTIWLLIAVHLLMRHLQHMNSSGSSDSQTSQCQTSQQSLLQKPVSSGFILLVWCCERDIVRCIWI